jgi:hypothetical protein
MRLGFLKKINEFDKAKASVKAHELQMQTQTNDKNNTSNPMESSFNMHEFIKDYEKNQLELKKKKFEEENKLNFEREADQARSIGNQEDQQMGYEDTLIDFLNFLNQKIPLDLINNFNFCITF